MDKIRAPYLFFYLQDLNGYRFVRPKRVDIAPQRAKG
jgi:hypothetical protein